MTPMTSEEIDRRYRRNNINYNRIRKQFTQEFSQLKEVQEIKFIKLALSRLDTVDIAKASIIMLCDTCNYCSAIIDFAKANYHFEFNLVAGFSPTTNATTIPYDDLIDRKTLYRQIKYLKQLCDILDDIIWLRQ